MKDTGGAAFPIPPIGTGDPRDGMTRGSDGITTRDYFAAKAMQALIGHMGSDMAEEEFKAQGFSIGQSDKFVAIHSYRYADAMLKERNNETL